MASTFGGAAAAPAGKTIASRNTARSRRFTLSGLYASRGLRAASAKPGLAPLTAGRRMQKLVVTLAAFAALAGPSLARAGDVAMRVQEVPLGARTLAAAPSLTHFNMLALHWIGSRS